MADEMLVNIRRGLYAVGLKPERRTTIRRGLDKGVGYRPGVSADNVPPPRTNPDRRRPHGFNNGGFGCAYDPAHLWHLPPSHGGCRPGV